MTLPVHLRSTLALALVSIAVCPAFAVVPEPGGAAPAAPFPPGDAAKTSLFRSLLKFSGLEPVKAVEEAENGDVVLVFFGRLGSPFPDWPAATLSRTVVGRGGSVLIATDRAADLRGFIPGVDEFGITGHPVTCREKSACLAGLPGMPFIIPTPSPDNPGLRWTAQLSRVATNGPSSFALLPSGNNDYRVEVLGRLPDECRYAGNGQQLQTHAAAISVTRPGAAGMAHVYTDPGIFTNELLTAKGTDNLAYAYHLATHLIGGPDGSAKRTKCLFIENGVVVDDFDDSFFQPARVPPLSPPVPSLEQIQDKLTDAVDRTLAGVQDRDVLGRAVARSFDRVVPILAVVAAALALVFVLWRSWAARHTPEPLPAPRAGADAGGSLLDDRRQAILRANDVYEPLREHLRALFAHWGQAAGGPSLPPVDVPGGGADRRLLESKLGKLWEFAYGDVPTAVPFARWKELEPMIEFVTRAADAGRWRFAGQGGAA